MVTYRYFLFLLSFLLDSRTPTVREASTESKEVKHQGIVLTAITQFWH